MLNSINGDRSELCPLSILSLTRRMRIASPLVCALLLLAVSVHGQRKNGSSVQALLLTSFLSVEFPLQLMVLGGIDADGNVLSDVEIVDLSDEDNVPTCFKPLDLPVPLFSAVGAYVNGGIYVCGGTDDLGDVQDACFFYSKELDVWIDAGFRLLTPRSDAQQLK